MSAKTKKLDFQNKFVLWRLRVYVYNDDIAYENSKMKKESRGVIHERKETRFIKSSVCGAEQK